MLKQKRTIESVHKTNKPTQQTNKRNMQKKFGAFNKNHIIINWTDTYELQLR